MQVQRSALVGLLTALEYKDVSKWNDQKLQRTLDALSDKVDDSSWSGLDKGQTNLLRNIVKHQSAENPDDITIIGDKAPPAAATAKKGVKAAPPPDEDDSDDGEAVEEEVAAEAPPPKKGAKKATPAKAAVTANGKAPPKKAGGPKGPGIIASIVEFLQAASEKKPITKQGILEKLCKRFDNPSESMMKTVNVQVPSRIRTDKGLTVEKNANGYWIES